MQDYVECLTDIENNIVDNYLKAEYTIIGGLLDLNTNVPLLEGIPIDIYIKSGLWDKVKGSIINYAEFKNEIELVVKYARENEVVKNSINVNLNNILSQVSDFIAKIKEVDLSKEGIAEMLEVLDTERNEINKIIDPSKVVETKKPRKKKEILQ